MKCTLLMCGGSSYSPCELKEATEHSSLQAAKDAAIDFWDNDSGRTPCAEDVQFHFFRSSKASVLEHKRDPYPDEVWSRNKRGNVKRERA